MIAGALALLALFPAADSTPALDVPFEKFVLDNGLTLIVHEDRKAPIVAVNVWYHVGSKNEKPGKTGFAHLFEHLMFNGSENFNDDYFKALDRLGATGLNGTTNEDRTNYFQNVPASALDAVLWIESDRMGHLLGAIDQAKLDEQRGVVQNEKRQSENQPYSLSREMIARAAYPAGHPYSWTTIGSMEDLNAASLADVKEWFKAYYGAANATLVVAGDIDAPAALEKVKNFFGDIPSGPSIARPTSWIAERTGVLRQRAEDRVPQARIYKIWNIPGWGTAASDYLELAAHVLAGGKSSRLYKRIVYDERLATDVSASVDDSEIGGLFRITATAHIAQTAHTAQTTHTTQTTQPGGGLEAIERAIDEELERFIDAAPTADEIDRAQIQLQAGFIRRLERIGGFGGKSDVLAMGQVYAGNPAHYKTMWSRTAAARPADLQMAVKRWLSDGAYVLEIHPFPRYSAAKEGADRSRPPEAGAPPAAVFPKLHRTTLSCGLEVILAERHSIPIVNFDLIVGAGHAADRPARAGTASLALSMLDEGTARRSALQIGDEIERLGAHLSASSSLDSSSVRLSALRARLDESIELFADVALHPAFPPADFERIKKERLAQIQMEKTRPPSIAQRVLPGLIFGKEHPYGLPESGFEASVARLAREDLAGFHAAWFRPENAKLIVVGDTTLAEIAPKLEAVFKSWRKGSTQRTNPTPVEHRERPEIFLVDRPGSIQSVILAGHVAPPYAAEREAAIDALNLVLGGSFTSRINMNLREEKHWSYGAGSSLRPVRGQRSFAVRAPVQTDKTRESMEEIAKELRAICGAAPVTAAELAKAQDVLTRTLPGSWETMDGVGGAIETLLRHGLPDDHFTFHAAKIRALKPADIEAAARELLRPDKLVWVVVGDRAKIEAGIRDLRWGEVRIVDADGKISP